MITRKEARKMGFTDHVPETWYLCKPVGEYTTLNVTIDKETGRIDAEVLNEHFLQPEYYGNMKEPYRSALKWAIDVELHELALKGLDVPFNHSEYGFKEEK